MYFTGVSCMYILAWKSTCVVGTCMNTKCACMFHMGV